MQLADLKTRIVRCSALWLASWLPNAPDERDTGLRLSLSQFLLSTAWERTRAGEHAVRPWPWANFWPVARLSAPQLRAEVFVFAGAGRAYGPSHIAGSSMPGEAGRCVIAAHEAQKIDFLQRMQMGDTLFLETPQGERHVYTVQDAAIRHRRELRAPSPNEQNALVLMARYEPDLTPEPLHYVVECAAA